jgi:predicted lipoprotein with Yx(FWY)xxD motif
MEYLMRGLLAVIAVAAAVAVPASASAGARSSVAVHASKYGHILFDGRGFALYTFTRDPRGQSTCSGACAKYWPPLHRHQPPDRRRRRQGIAPRNDPPE